MTDLFLSNVRILTPAGLERTTIGIEDGRIASIGARAGAHVVDGGDCLALPGIVDLHGDAFERQLMPRPGVHFDPHLALLDTDRQLVANGITTAFHSITYSWEPGLRSREAGQQLMTALENMRERLTSDTRLHLRWETFNLDAEDEILDWLTNGRIDLLAFNDHTQGMVREARQPDKLSKYLERTGLDCTAFVDLLNRTYGRADEVGGAIGRLAAAALSAGIPMASHDDTTPHERVYYAGLGCRISEFPKNEETARTARDAGHEVVMGAPNVVRGRSHLSAASAAHLVAENLCTILTSDYYYPSLAQAAFRLARDGVCDLATSWKLISENPAKAAGLHDRGSLAIGKRADLVLIDDSVASLPRVMATVAHGRPMVFGHINRSASRELRAAS